MKEVALAGLSSRIYAEVLSALLHRNMAVNAMVNNPERMMLDDVNLTTTHLDVANADRLAEMFEGYHDVIMVFNDDLTDAESNDFTLHHFAEMVNAARRAGVARVVVVGSPDSSAFFMGDLKRQDDIDWIFVSTEGNYAETVADEVMQPRYHREEVVL